MKAWRALRSRPALSALIAASLAIGIAANAVLFAVIDAAVLRPFPFPEPERLVGVGAAFPRLNQPLDFFESLSGPEYAAIKENAQSLEAIAGFDLGNEPVMAGDTPARVFTGYFWDDAFATLRLAPLAGRAFTAEELRTGAPVAIVSHAFWRNTLSGAPDAVGRSLRVGGQPHTIVGIMPPRTRIYGTDLWVPMREAAGTLPQTRRQFNVLARLRPGADIAAANAEFVAIARRVEQQHGAAVPEYQGFEFGARPWTEIEVWGFGGIAGLSFAAAGFLLVLITANLANLLLARAGDRRREMAVRTALGASRRALAFQVIGETALVTAIGAAGGILLAWIGIRAAPSLIGDFLPEDAVLQMSGRLIAFVVAASAAVAALVSLAPVLQLSRTDPAEALSASGTRTAGSRAGRRVQGAIVALQVAIAVLVTGSAALLAANVTRVLGVDPGFPHDDVLTMRITLPLPRYEGGRSMVFFDTLMERTRALPHVADASVSNQPPPGLFSRAQFSIDGRTAGDALPSAFFTTAGSHYRETLGLEVARGRWFDERHDRGGPREVVINEEAAARFFGDTDPIGQRLRISPPHSDRTPTEIVGVVRSVRNRGLSLEPGPEIIASVRQIPDRRQSQLYLVARGRNGTGAILNDVRAVMRGIDPEQPVYAVSTLASQYEEGVAPRRAAAGLLGFFAALALALSALGIYGVVSHAVGTRTREIGVRAALGATRGTLARMVVADAMRPVGAGVVLGIALVLGGSKTLAAWIFGVQPEPVALALATALLVAVGIAASLLPARRASRIDPITALRRT